MQEIDPNFIKGFTIAIGALGPAIALGMLASSAVKSVGRNPDANNKILTMALILGGLIDAVMVFVLLIVFTIG